MNPESTQELLRRLNHNLASLKDHFVDMESSMASHKLLLELLLERAYADRAGALREDMGTLVQAVRHVMQADHAQVPEHRLEIQARCAAQLLQMLQRVETRMGVEIQPAASPARSAVAGVAPAGAPSAVPLR